MISFIIPFRSNEPERIESFNLVYATLVTDFPDDEVIVADSSSYTDGPFNRSQARNWGAEDAEGDVLVFVDADSYVPKDQLVRAVAACPAWCFPYDQYFALSEKGTKEFYSGLVASPEYDYVFPGSDPLDRPASEGGCVVVSRQAFAEVHGYDERFIGWGFEDRCFKIALETLCGPELRIPGPLWHLWHPEPEEQRFRQPHIGHNRDLYADYGAAKGYPEKMRALVGGH